MKNLQDIAKWSAELDVIVSDLEVELFNQKFAKYFPKLHDILTIGGGIPKDEVTELNNRFNSYFPHLSNLLSTART